MPKWDLRIILCNMAMVSLAITQNMPPLLFTTFSAEFGGDAGLAPAVLSRIPMITYAVMMATVLVFGPLADRYGAKPITFAGLIAAMGGILLIVFAESFGHVLVAAAVFGVSAICLDVVLSPIVAAIQPRNRGSALNRLHTWFCVGSLLIAAFISGGLWVGVPWRVLLMLIALVPLINLIGFLRVSALPLIHEDHRTVTLGELVRFRPFPLLLGIMALAGATEASITQWLPAYAETELGYSRELGGFALACFSIAMSIGRYGMGRYIQSHNSVRMMQGVALGAAVLYLAAGLLPVPAAALCAAVMLGLFVGCMFPTGMAISGDALPSGGATFYGLLAAAGCLGGVVSQWVIGGVATHFSLTVAITVCALYALGLMLGLTVYGRTLKQRDVERPANL